MSTSPLVTNNHNLHKLDAVIAAPDSHEILFENTHLRVLEVIVKPIEYKK